MSGLSLHGYSACYLHIAGKERDAVSTRIVRMVIVYDLCCRGVHESTCVKSDIACLRVKDGMKAFCSIVCNKIDRKTADRM